jgi:hypothetical protein
LEADESARRSGRCPMHGGARDRRHTRVEDAVRSRRYVDSIFERRKTRTHAALRAPYQAFTQHTLG